MSCLAWCNSLRAISSIINLMVEVSHRLERLTSAPTAPTEIDLLHFRTPGLDGSRIKRFSQHLQATTRVERNYQHVVDFSERLLGEKQTRISRVGQEIED